MIVGFITCTVESRYGKLDRTEKLSRLEADSIPLDAVKNRTLKSISVAANGHLIFEFNRGNAITIPRNMADVPILNHILAIEVKPFSLTITLQNGQVITQSKENEFIDYRELPALLTQTLGNSPIFKRLVTKGFIETRDNQIYPHLGVKNYSQENLFSAWWYRTLHLSLTGGGWRVVPFNGSSGNATIASLNGNVFTLKKGRYWFQLTGAAGLVSAASTYGKYRLYDITHAKVLGYSPAMYSGTSMVLESSAADVSFAIEVPSDNTQIQLQVRVNDTCRLGGNVDWGYWNCVSLVRLD